MTSQSQSRAKTVRSAVKITGRRWVAGLAQARRCSPLLIKRSERRFLERPIRIYLRARTNCSLPPSGPQLSQTNCVPVSGSPVSHRPHLLSGNTDNKLRRPVFPTSRERSAWNFFHFATNKAIAKSSCSSATKRRFLFAAPSLTFQTFSSRVLPPRPERTAAILARGAQRL